MPHVMFLLRVERTLLLPGLEIFFLPGFYWKLILGSPRAAVGSMLLTPGRVRYPQGFWDVLFCLASQRRPSQPRSFPGHSWLEPPQGLPQLGLLAGAG